MPAELVSLFSLARNFSILQEEQTNWSSLDKKIFTEAYLALSSCKEVEAVSKKLEHRVNIFLGKDRLTIADRIEGIWVFLCECFNRGHYFKSSTLILDLMKNLDLARVGQEIDRNIREQEDGLQNQTVFNNTPLKACDSLQTLFYFFKNKREELSLEDLKALNLNDEFTQKMQAKISLLPSSLSLSISSMIEETNKIRVFPESEKPVNMMNVVPLPHEELKITTLFVATALTAARANQNGSYAKQFESLVQDFEKQFAKRNS